jgi:hypothetical protein
MVKRRSKNYRRFSWLHKWLGIVLTLFLIFFALSGIVLNHRQLFSSVDINRKFLPPVYRYSNWNLASVRGSLYLGGDSTLVYGNIGIWKVKNGFREWIDFNNGFPAGIDNHKVSKVVISPTGRLFAGTYFGLYELVEGTWQNLPLPVKEERVTDLFLRKNELNILTRSHLLTADLSTACFVAQEVKLPPANDDDGKAGLFKTLWIIHSGEILGAAGKLIVDFMALVMIFLSITGIVLWLFPSWIRKLKRKGKQVKPKVATMRFSLRWHNKLGFWFFALLSVSALTGMFLRPPLLIPIAGARVAKIPFTVTDAPNPWFDKLRGGIYDETGRRYIFSTSEGFYYSDDDFGSVMKRFTTEPPVSVMGINVLEKMGFGGFLVGSFSGLYSWFPDENYIENTLTGRVIVGAPQSGNPFSADAISGIVWDNGRLPFLLDYDRGAIPLRHSETMPPMPENVLRASPMSLWNFALEMHTARIYSTIIGDFYILIIPLAGLSLLIILFSGLWMYLKKFRKRHPSRR